MTIKFAVFFVVLILMSACNGDKKAPFTDVNTSTSAIPVANQPEKIVLNFYRWYLKNVYQKEMVESAEVKLTTDSLYQLDASKHLAFLKKVGYFSSSFYENERSVYKACDSALTKVSRKQVEESGGNAADFVQGNDCAFLNYMNWTGGQGETLNTVNIINSKISGQSAMVTAVLGDSTGFKYSYPIITLALENNSWKICRIEISYDAPKK